MKILNIECYGDYGALQFVDFAKQKKYTPLNVINNLNSVCEEFEEYCRENDFPDDFNLEDEFKIEVIDSDCSLESFLQIKNIFSDYDALKHSNAFHEKEAEFKI